MSDEKLDLILNVVTDIKARQEGVGKDFKADVSVINRLELEIISLRENAIDMREKVQKLESRILRLENHIGLAV